MSRDLTILDPSGLDDALHRHSDVPVDDEPHLDRFADAATRRTFARDPSNLRFAAVLLPLVHHNDEWHLLFIRRAANERDRHSGQVAFPGGAREAGDATAEATALREAREEIGIDASSVTLLGSLTPYLTISRYEVTPVAGIINWPTTLKLQTTEVARTFLIPLDWLRRRENFTLRARSDIDPETARRHPVIVYEPYDQETLWGASARMTLNFLKAIDEGGIMLPRTGRAPAAR